MLAIWFTGYLKSAVKTYWPEKKVPFKILLLGDIGPGHQGALMETYKEMNVVVMGMNLHLAAHESRSNVYFQVLLLKKYIL